MPEITDAHREHAQECYNRIADGAEFEPDCVRMIASAIAATEEREREACWAILNDRRKALKGSFGLDVPVLLFNLGEEIRNRSRKDPA